MGTIKTLDSGAVLDLTLAPFEAGHKLLKAVMREIEQVNVSKEALSGEMNEGALNTIKSLLARLIYSDAVEAALWPCMDRALYNNKRISKDLFEDEAARADYLPVVKEVLLFNLSPFTKNLTSLLSEVMGKPTGSQE